MEITRTTGITILLYFSASQPPTIKSASRETGRLNSIQPSKKCSSGHPFIQQNNGRLELIPATEITVLLYSPPANHPLLIIFQEYFYN